jgi:rSAM/selenodomain-associated transferase 1
MPADVLLQQFARAPIPGEVKTRMLPYLSKQEACDLHRELVLWTTSSLVRSGVGEVELCVSGDKGNTLFDLCLGLGATRITEQHGDDLGSKMHHALNRALQSYRKVILVGSDCPGIDTTYLEQAITALDRAPLVLGPAEDGGYVLIGATRIDDSLFANIDWGSHQVLRQTLDRCDEQGFDRVLLPALADIDRPEDLAIWRALRRH